MDCFAKARGAVVLLVRRHRVQPACRQAGSAPAGAFSILTNKGLTLDRPIRLLACNTGQKSSGFAQKFANLAKQSVIAPTSKVRLNDSFEIVLEKKGVFKEFKPK